MGPALTQPLPCSAPTAILLWQGSTGNGAGSARGQQWVGGSSSSVEGLQCSRDSGTSPRPGLAPDGGGSKEFSPGCRPWGWASCWRGRGGFPWHRSGSLPALQVWAIVRQAAQGTRSQWLGFGEACGRAGLGAFSGVEQSHKHLPQGMLGGCYLLGGVGRGCPCPSALELLVTTAITDPLEMRWEPIPHKLQT